MVIKMTSSSFSERDIFKIILDNKFKKASELIENMKKSYKITEGDTKILSNTFKHSIYMK